MKLVTVLVQRDTVAQIPLTVRAYEVPILKLIHGKAMVNATSEAEIETPEGLNAEDEFDRLCLRYGYNAKRETHWAEMAYGDGGAEFEAAFKKATAVEKKAAAGNGAGAATEPPK
ncbi:hypothetical protein [Lysobacter sp. CA199]|uniref:hypothetical protein n=1 Tax=Lysobacter sp. CA199 TaxID=3455608 RepID=UPI003F8D255D